jgi:hypothetical protein
MQRPPLQVADIIRAAGPAFVDPSHQRLTWLHVKVLTGHLPRQVCGGASRTARARQLGFHGGLASLQNEKAFAALLRSLFRADWVVYSKRPFDGAEQVRLINHSGNARAAAAPWC